MRKHYKNMEEKERERGWEGGRRVERGKEKKKERTEKSKVPTALSV